MKLLIPFLLILALLAACTPSTRNSADPINSSDFPAPTDGIDPNQPVSSDDPLINPQKIDNTVPRHAEPDLVRAGANVQSAELLTMESFPPQFSLALSGELPTPCNQLRVDVMPPDGENKIVVDVYSLVSPDTMCADVIQPFSENIPLGSFPAGHYTIWINGEKVAEFDA